MGNAIKSIFGGTDKSAQKAQEKANANTQDYIERQAGQAREDVMGMFPESQAMRQAGFQQALDVLGGSIPEQARLFNQGSVGAQQALISGMNPFQQAILGQQIDTSGFQPVSMQADTSWIPSALAKPQAPIEQQPIEQQPAWQSPSGGMPMWQDPNNSGVFGGEMPQGLQDRLAMLGGNFNQRASGGWNGTLLNRR